MLQSGSSLHLIRAFVALSTGLSVSLFYNAFSCGRVDAATVPSLINQAQTASSSGVEVKTLSLTGTVTWTAGSTTDSGTFTLTAGEDGSNTMDLVMSGRGAYQETYAAIGSGRSCQWQGADSVAHATDSSSCSLPASWFLPSMSLQSTVENIGISDNGLSAFGPSSMRVLNLSNVGTGSPALASMPADYGVETLGLDPATLLPASAKYRLFPRNNPLSAVAVEVDYTEYVKAGGVQIPRSIVRRLNGSVDLVFTVTTVTVGQSQSVSL